MSVQFIDDRKMLNVEITQHEIKYDNSQGKDKFKGMLKGKSCTRYSSAY